eukprot:335654-Chlamydomonas_euryale.AAC.1
MPWCIAKLTNEHEEQSGLNTPPAFLLFRCGIRDADPALLCACACSIPVKQGDDGLTEFTTRIRDLFRLPEDVDISLTFGCKEPLSGRHLKLEGVGAFDAAVHCASVAAAERQHK